MDITENRELTKKHIKNMEKIYGQEVDQKFNETIKSIFEVDYIKSLSTLQQKDLSERIDKIFDILQETHDSHDAEISEFIKELFP
jgi:hypothetical protein